MLVVGLARSGLASIDLLLEKGARVTATDLNPRTSKGLRVPFLPQTPEAFAARDLIVVSPGVPPDLPELEFARRGGVKVIGEVELAGWFLLGDTIGVTGANGKTTTTALLGHILDHAGIPAQVGGNIGTPATSLAATSRPGRWNVLELSSFQLETIETFRARVGVALNVTEDHLDRHHTMEAYIAAKARLFETQQPGDFAVLNADDPACVGFAAHTRARPLWFSLTRPVTPGLWLDQGRILFDDALVLRAAEVPLRGRHNLENVMAATAAARLAGASLEAIASAVRVFAGVEHRLESVRRVGGVEFVNDSKATNPDAALKALDSFDGRLWVILGGKDKGSNYRPLREPLKRKAHAVMLIGAAAEKIADHLAGSVRLVPSGTLEAAISTAWREAGPGDTVLLAPACASFDQFDDFEHRGRVFKELVARLREDKA
ncbi:MAG: UDP-N-acetylmuramoyl-L-alanine--D-glutamate ligase [Bryobacteraceae bacterium]